MNAKITNEIGNEILTLKHISNQKFNKPVIYYDILKEKEVPPIIKYIEPEDSLDILKEFNLALYSIPIPKEKKWLKRQKERYQLIEESLDKTIFTKYDGTKKLKKLPKKCIIEIDIANKKARLWSDKISPNIKFSEWIYY